MRNTLDEFERKLSLLSDICGYLKELKEEIGLESIDVKTSSDIASVMFQLIVEKRKVFSKVVVIELEFYREKVRFFITGINYTYDATYNMNGKLISKIKEIAKRYIEKVENDDGLPVVVDDLLEGGG